MRFEDIQNLLDKYGESIKGLEHTPMKVTFSMETPIATNDFIYFDGLLAYCVMRDLFKEKLFNIREYKSKRFEIPLPLKQSGKKYRYYHASVGLSDEKTEFVTRWKKMFDVEHSDFIDFGGKSERIDNRRGFFKAYSIPLVCKYTKQLYFYANGSIDEVRRLLKHLAHIGKKGSQGWGRVSGFSVERIDRDRSVFDGKKVMRPIPTKELTIKQVRGRWMRLNAFRPPYWHSKNMTECVIPERDGRVF